MANTTPASMARQPITPAQLEPLSANFRGTICLYGDAGYDEARTIWNAMIDRHPAVIFRCIGAADVMQAIKFANEHGLPIAVRGGGHNIAGNAVADGAAMIDLSAMRTVRVDPKARRAWVGPGATLGDVDKETQVFGLALPTGINSTTGISGLTLGGGFGWLTRPFGMTIDNLVGADVVTAAGALTHASEKDNPELFWALRGGGGNFGIVTDFEFNLHRVGPEIYCGLILHPFEKAAELLKGYQRVLADAPDELTVWCIMREAPPAPFVPAEWQGGKVLGFGVCFAGAMDDGEKAVAALRSLGEPIVDLVGPLPFAGWQASFDPLLAPGARNYWKTHDFTELSNGAITTIIDGVSQLPGPECEVFIGHVGGAMNRVAPEATAYPYRKSHFIMNVHTRWREAADDDAFIVWARGLFEAATPFATGGGYVNFIPADEPDRVEKVYGDNYRRLAEVKRQWDPENRFRLNQNILPAT